MQPFLVAFFVLCAYGFQNASFYVKVRFSDASFRIWRKIGFADYTDAATRRKRTIEKLTIRKLFHKGKDGIDRTESLFPPYGKREIGMREAELYFAEGTRVLAAEYSSAFRKVRRRAPPSAAGHRSPADRPHRAVPRPVHPSQRPEGRRERI